MIVGRYDYFSIDGKLLYWKERVEPGRNGAKKEFFFWHGNRKRGRGCEPVIYNLPGIVKAKALIFTEGEKQADIVNNWQIKHVAGTTFDSGSNSKFPPIMAAMCYGKSIAILRDNDEPGMGYAQMIAQALQRSTRSIKIVLLPDLPEKGDICDWILTPGNDKERLLQIIRETPRYVFMQTPKKKPPIRKRLSSPNGKVTDNMIEAANEVPIDSLLEFQGGFAKCLWHEEKTASLHYHAPKNICKCFGCGKGGGAITVAMRLYDLPFLDAVKFLCQGR